LAGGGGVGCCQKLARVSHLCVVVVGSPDRDRRTTMNTIMNRTASRRSPFFAATDLGELFDAVVGGAHAAVAPSMPIDVSESEDGITVTANVPGFTKDEVGVEFHEGVLTISATRTAKSVEGDSCGTDCCKTAAKPARTLVRERPTSSVRRALHLPERVSGEGIKADLTDGVLTVTVPYTPRPTPRKISVN
jgi:HSP20 family protein